MAEIVWTLDRILKEMEITPNRLSVEAKIRPNTVYNMVYNKAVRFHFDTAVRVLVALNRIAEEENIHKRFDIPDILEYRE